MGFAVYLYHCFIILTAQLQTGLGWRQEMLSTLQELTPGESEQ